MSAPCPVCNRPTQAVPTCPRQYCQLAHKAAEQARALPAGTHAAAYWKREAVELARIARSR